MIIAGLGFRSICAAEDIAALVRRVAAATGVEVSRLAAPAFKAEAPALRRAAEILGLEVVLARETALAAVQHLCLTRSQAAQTATGFASVAEACALAAAGPGARLLGPRTSNGVATCALARGEGDHPFHRRRRRRPDHCARPGAVVPLRGVPLRRFDRAAGPLGLCPGRGLVDTAPLTLDEIVAETCAPTPRGSTSRGCIPATCRSTAPWPSNCDGSSGWAFPIP